MSYVLRKNRKRGRKIIPAATTTTTISIPSAPTRTRPDLTLRRTADGQYDAKNLQLINLNNPTLDNDAVNLSTLNSKFDLTLHRTNSTQFDAQNLQITNLNEPSSDKDAVNLG